MNSHQVSVAAGSYTATLFAWAGFDVSVQYASSQTVPVLLFYKHL
ncbi:hypothetical protein [Virgibacillus siamensis]|nr:hypothetical protein [Virgibacillus siamensis]